MKKNIQYLPFLHHYFRCSLQIICCSKTDKLNCSSKLRREGRVSTCVQRKTPVRFRSITSCHCDFLILINNVSRVIPGINFVFQLLEVKQIGTVSLLQKVKCICEYLHYLRVHQLFPMCQLPGRSVRIKKEN